MHDYGQILWDFLKKKILIEILPGLVGLQRLYVNLWDFCQVLWDYRGSDLFVNLWDFCQVLWDYRGSDLYVNLWDLCQV